MLEIENLNVNYGAIHAIKGISMAIGYGEVVAVLGSNGAGKTTLMRAITGLVKPRDGRIRFAGKEINDVPPFKRVNMGLAMVPEGRGVFPNLTVRENLLLGAYVHRRETAALRPLMEKLLAGFPRLKERLKQKAGTLSGGEQQMLAICRALMSRPRLLLLDEPSMGLSPILVNDVFKLISQIRAEGTTILLVEQNANAALSVADRGYVLEMGVITLAGTAAELSASDQVRAAYLA
ncbi:MAG: ABC transporter ATP-binding protein [Bacillota bacterium]